MNPSYLFSLSESKHALYRNQPDLAQGRQISAVSYTHLDVYKRQVLKDPVQQEMINSAEKELALWWVKKFWETPLRTGKRRYYDNCLYMFAFLALAGKYRIW